MESKSKDLHSSPRPRNNRMHLHEQTNDPGTDICVKSIQEKNNINPQIEKNALQLRTSNPNVPLIDRYTLVMIRSTKLHNGLKIEGVRPYFDQSPSFHSSRLRIYHWAIPCRKPQRISCIEIRRLPAC